MKTRAAVAWKADAPLIIETVDLDGPKAGEALIEIMATGVCHTDASDLTHKGESIRSVVDLLSACVTPSGRRRPLVRRRFVFDGEPPPFDDPQESRAWGRA